MSTSARATELAKIHIAAQQLGLRRRNDDESYRAMLWSVARVRSAKDLDEPGRRAVLEHLRRCGFVDSPRRGEHRYVRGTPAALIRWLWTQLADAGLVGDKSDRALRRYIGQHAGLNTVADERAPQHLSPRETHIVIEQLKRWLARKDSNA